jgi:hypothetical protein
MDTPGHSKSGVLPSVVVPVAAVFAVALAKKEEKLLAGSWKIDGIEGAEPPEQPASTAPSTATAAATRIPGRTERIPTPRIIND